MPAQSMSTTARSQGNAISRIGQQRAELGVLVLNGGGAVVSCSDAALRMFDCEVEALKGVAIGDLIAGLARSHACPGQSARFLAYLCSGRSWHRFVARDFDGRKFDVELALARIQASSEDLFALYLRDARDR